MTDVRTGGSAIDGEQKLCYDELGGLEGDHERNAEHSSLVLGV